MTNEAFCRRALALAGLVLAAVVAVWWLGSSRLALAHGADATRPADQALAATEMLRALVLALVALPLGATLGGRPSVRAVLGLLAPSWPLVVLAWAASTRAGPDIAMREGLLLLGAWALPWAGQGWRRLLPSAEAAAQAATLSGVVLAAALWATRGAWLAP